MEYNEITQKKKNNTRNNYNDIQICNITMNIDYIIYVAFKKKYIYHSQNFIGNSRKNFFFSILQLIKSNFGSIGLVI